MDVTLITGSEGYIGSNLKVYMDSLELKYQRYDKLIGLNVLDLDSLFDYTSYCNNMIHLAGIAGVKACEENPTEAYKNNELATNIIAEICNFWKIQPIFTSSFAAKKPRSIYGLNKEAAEKAILDVGGVVLRLANVYGGIGFNSKNTLIKQLYHAKWKKRKIMLNGDGSQTRSFIHVYDVCRAIVIAMNAPSGIYEVSTDKVHSVLEVAKMFNVKYGFNKDADVGVENVEVDKSKWLPTWKPEIKLETGINSLRKRG